MLKVSLGYMACSRPDWALQDPISTKQKKVTTAVDILASPSPRVLDNLTLFLRPTPLLLRPHGFFSAPAFPGLGTSLILRLSPQDRSFPGWLPSHRDPSLTGDRFSLRAVKGCQRLSKAVNEGYQRLSKAAWLHWACVRWLHEDHACRNRVNLGARGAGPMAAP